MSLVNFSDLEGQTLTAIMVDHDNDKITFNTESGRVFEMYHDQDCCESVTVEDICGNTEDLIGQPLVMADERSHSGEDGDIESYTWTFYILATVRGAVTIRWYGTSNGYYSESVSLYEVKKQS